MDQSLNWSRRELWMRKLVYPGHTLPTAAAPALVAAGLAYHDHALHPAPLAAAFAAGWLIQLGGVLTDNYVNLQNEPEDREHPQLVQALKTGLLSLRTLQVAIYACFALAFAAGALLLYHAGVGVVVIGTLSVAAALAYSAGPFPLGRIGVADPLFFFFFGAVSVAGCYFVQAPQAFPLLALVFGIPVGALTTNILIIDDIRDRDFDVLKGKRTIAVRFGVRWSRREFVALLALAYASPFWFWQQLGFGEWILLPLLTLPFAALTARKVMTLARHEDLIPVTPEMGRLLLAYCALLAAGVALA